MTCEKSDRADGALQRRTENVKGEKVECEMQKAAMQKKRSEKTPVFALYSDCVRLDRPNPMQDCWIVPAPRRNLEQENKHID